MKELNIRNRYLFLEDILICAAAYVLIIAVAFPISSFVPILQSWTTRICITALIYFITYALFSIYKIDWVHSSVRDCTHLAKASGIAAVLNVLLSVVFPDGNTYLKLNLVANALIVLLIFSLRYTVRLMRKLSAWSSSGGKRVLIIGAGNLALALMRDIHENERLDYNIVGLIDDDPAKQKMSIYGSKVLGTRNDIARICETHNIDEIIFAIASLEPKQRTELLGICSTTDKKVKILSCFEENLNGIDYKHMLHDVEIEDLLERDEIKLNNDLIASDICGKTVLVTGGGGSIGSELCRQIIKYKPETLIILDIYENTTYVLPNELSEKYPEQKIEVLIASVRDKARLDAIFEKYKPDIVFHAAAHKHVPLMEFSPGEAIKNNVFGTYNTAMCARKHKIKCFVMISTDKAVNPTNIMGASKRMCEMIIQTMQKTCATKFVAVRFGNVLGSNGSVITRFKKQIEKGGPVTVTHPEITRFFMTIPEAAQLVLQAAAYANGGEIFVLDMGSPVKIYDLARKMISLSGFKPDVDIDIVFTGLRPGEKLYEELLMDEEGLKKTQHDKIFVGQPIDIDEKQLSEKLEQLKAAIPQDNETIKKIMSEVVPTYHYKK